MRVEVAVADWSFDAPLRVGDFGQPLSRQRLVVSALWQALAEAEQQLNAIVCEEGRVEIENACSGLIAGVLTELEIRDRVNQRILVLLDGQEEVTGMRCQNALGREP